MVPYIEEYLSRDPEDPVTLRDRDKFLDKLKDSVLAREITERDRSIIIQDLGRLTGEAQVYRALNWFNDRNKKGWDSLNLTLLDVDAIVNTRQFCVEYASWFANSTFDYSTAKTDKLLVGYMKNYVQALGVGGEAWSEFARFKKTLFLGAKFKCFSSKILAAAQQILIPKERKFLTILQEGSSGRNQSNAFGQTEDVTEIIVNYQMKILHEFFNAPEDNIPAIFSGYIAEITSSTEYKSKQRILDAIQSYYLTLLDKRVSDAAVLAKFVVAKVQGNLDEMLLFREKSWETTDYQCRWFVSVFTKEFFVREMIHQKLRIDTRFLSSDQRKPLRDSFFPTLDLLQKYHIISREEYTKFKEEGVKFL